MSDEGSDSDMADDPEEATSESEEESSEGEKDAIAPAPPRETGVDSLENLSIEALIKSLNISKDPDSTPETSMLESLTPKMKCSLVIGLDRSGASSESMQRLLASPEIVLPALSVTSKRDQMLVAFQKPIHEKGSEFIAALAKSVDDKLKQLSPDQAALYFPQVSVLASILLDSAWPDFAETVLVNMLACCSDEATDDFTVVGAKLMLLSSLTMQLKLAEAERLMENLRGLRVLREDRADVKALQLSATFYMECSRLHLEKSSDFKLAYSEAMKAVNCLREEHPVRLTVDVYRMASRASVMRRKDVAKVLIREAFLLARDKFGPESVAYAESLADLGFYWLGSGTPGARFTCQGAFDKALKIFDSIFKEHNFQQVPIRELSDEMFVVDEYINFNSVSSLHSLIKFYDGKNERDFDDLEEDNEEEDLEDGEAREGSDKRKDELKMSDIRDAHLVDAEHHPLAANGRRIEAILTLMSNRLECWRKIQLYWRRGGDLGADEFEDLDSKLDHVKNKLVSSLDIAEKTFGGNSLQTARHLDSLGFFYRQTLKLSLAESTLQRALAMKEAVLDSDDRELATTLRQLAVVHCLRKEFDRAAPLIIRCIDIMGTTNTSQTILDFGLLSVCHEKSGNVSGRREWTRREKEWNALRFQLPRFRWAPDRELDVGADKPQSLADVAEELKRLGAFQ